MKFGIYISELYYNNNVIQVTNGLIKGNVDRVYRQDNQSLTFNPIIRSNNRNGGIEATWSLWLFIENAEFDTNAPNLTFSHIMNKGSPTQLDSYGNSIQPVNNAPGIYLHKNTNMIRVFMDTFELNNNYVDIEDIPVDRWFHLAIKITGNIVSVYINGEIASALKLESVPKQNYGNVFMGSNGGFTGFISNIWYYNYALGTVEMMELFNMGPSLILDSTVANAFQSPKSDMPNLGRQWYNDQLR